MMVYRSDGKQPETARAGGWQMPTKEMEMRWEGRGLAVQLCERIQASKSRKLFSITAGHGWAQAPKAKQVVTEAGLGRMSPPHKLHL